MLFLRDLLYDALSIMPFLTATLIFICSASLC
jgi:hypothetical protein